MKIYKLPQLAEGKPGGEFSIAVEDDNAGEIYLTYGRLLPKEASRKLTATQGRGEFIFILKGSARVRCGRTSFTVAAGEAFHSNEPEVTIENIGQDETVYTISGARAAKCSHPAKEESRPVEAEAKAVTEGPPEDDGAGFDITGE